MINAGDTTWLLVSAALVMFMTPGLALFYGGMVRSRTILNTMMLVFVCLAVVSLVWLAYGYSLAFSDDVGGGLLGGLRDAGLSGLADATVGATGHKVPLYAFAAFQLMFAAITVALLVGAVAERARFWPWLLFVAVWATVVYLPLAHWTFSFDGFSGAGTRGGWISNRLHALDFAGGTAVETNSGASAAALALIVGRRRGWPEKPVRPHNLPFVLFGAGLLWFGWFGFNAGSAITSGALASTAFVNTMVAGATAVLGWLVVEQLRDGKPTTLGAASGAVAGLVGITPACGFVEPWAAALIGIIAGAVCSLAVSLKFRFRLDDSLDVVGVHGIGGLVGMLLIGLFATVGVNAAGGDGLFYGGGLGQLGKQVVASLATIGYAFVATLIIAWVIERTVGLRVHRDGEASLDESEHAESAYEFHQLPTRRGHMIGHE